MNTLVKNWTEWLKNTRYSYMTEFQQHETLSWLLDLRDNILKNAQIKPTDTVIDIGTGNGLLAFGAYEIAGQKGKIILSDMSEECLDECRKITNEANISNIEFLRTDPDKINLPDNSVDVVVMRTVLAHTKNKQKSINEFYRILKPNGRLSFYEPLLSSNTRYNELVNIKKLNISEKIIAAEENVMNDPRNPLTNYTAESLDNNLKLSGFKEISIKLAKDTLEYPIKDGMVEIWFSSSPSPDSKTMEERMLEYLTQEELNKYKSFLIEETLEKMVSINTTSLYCVAIKN